jgi:type II secretory ATPase GspE/PulE/Tfp pilus assembly ATPase PilB-like protein
MRGAGRRFFKPGGHRTHANLGRPWANARASSRTGQAACRHGPSTLACAMENWPQPCFFKYTKANEERASAEAVIVDAEGGVTAGCLARFLPQSLSVSFSAHGESTVRTLNFSGIKSIQLAHPVALVADTELIELYYKTCGQTMIPGTRPFWLRFVDGEELRGRTQGLVRTRQGIFIFQVTEADLVVRIFIPENMLWTYQVDNVAGQRRAEAETAHEALPARPQPTPTDEHFGDGGISDSTSLADKVGQLHSFSPVRLGDILMNQGLVCRDQMFEALRQMRLRKHALLSHILVEMKMISRSKLTQAVADQLKIPIVSLHDFVVAPEALLLTPKAFAFEHQVLPLLATDKTLVVAVATPVDADYLDELRFSAQRQIVPLIVNPQALATRIASEYSSMMGAGGLTSVKEEIEELTQQLGSEEAFSEATSPNLLVSENDTLLVRLVNMMIIHAHKMGASDIHIEAYPEEQPTRIRFRIDGALSDYLLLPCTLRAAMISRLKIMASLDISERRKPQDGKIDFSRFAPLKLELRVASLPTVNGLEDIVMRLLASTRPMALAKLDFGPELVSRLESMMHRSYGLVLVCGPTGSGKTTTLHSLLAEVNTPEKKIWTAEDPIEITHPGLRQTQMLPRAGLTFATAMRAFLRADPDIIMVGEMRDAETTHIAIEASLTGHLLLSTLHTNSAPESVLRLLDMGLDPFSFSDALIGVLSQRLARRLCPHCKIPVEDSLGDLAKMAKDYCKGTALDEADVLAQWHTRFSQPGEAHPVLYRAAGCPQCNQTGHKGRVGIYELMTATPAIKKLIQLRAPVALIFQTAMTEGMLTLQQYGLLKVLEGVTDLHSVDNACA